MEADVDIRPTFITYMVLARMSLPLDTIITKVGVNFAMYLGGTLATTLCLFNLLDLKNNIIIKEIPLDSLINKTGSIWHIFLEGKFRDVAYGYKFDRKFSPEEGLYINNSCVSLDLYAKAILIRVKFDKEGDLDF